MLHHLTLHRVISARARRVTAHRVASQVARWPAGGGRRQRRGRRPAARQLPQRAVPGRAVDVLRPVAAMLPPPLAMLLMAVGCCLQGELVPADPAPEQAARPPPVLYVGLLHGAVC